jgi:hypothetical protein
MRKLEDITIAFIRNYSIEIRTMLVNSNRAKTEIFVAIVMYIPIFFHFSVGDTIEMIIILYDIRQNKMKTHIVVESTTNFHFMEKVNMRY